MDVSTATTTLNDGRVIPLLALGVYQIKEGKDTFQSVSNAFSFGVRHIDSAALYGNEKSVGEAIEASKVKRSNLFITTKLWVLDFEIGQNPYQFARDEAEISIKKLGSIPDLYLIHSPHHGKQNRLAFYRALCDMKTEGKLKSIGVSNYGVQHINEIVAAKLPLPAVNQIECHPFLQQNKIVKHCEKLGIKIQAYSPLARAKKRVMSNSTLQKIGKKYGKTVAQILIRWSLEKGFITLPKSVHSERIKENSLVFDFSLSESDMKELALLDEGLHTGWDPTTVK
tara:strand:+ start:494 stop:1342 length:849 start_codon:yes stop_codon:yes gene_type:complete